MTKRVTAKEFHEAGGVGDWRILYWGAQAFYATESFQQAVEFVTGIAAIASDIGHHPDIDLRSEGVTIKTFSDSWGHLSAQDIALAQRIQALASEQGLTADPSQLKAIGIAVAQDSGADVRPFWAAVLGYDNLEDTDAVDPGRRGPHFMFHELDPPKPNRGRFHIDLSIPADQVEARIEAAIAAGGRLVADNSPYFWTLASPENHGVDIAAFPDMEDFDD